MGPAFAALLGCSPGPGTQTADGSDRMDMGRRDGGVQPAKEPRVPWHTVSPTPEESNLQGVHGSSLSDYYAVSSGALIRRVAGASRVEVRLPQPGCLRSVLALSGDVFAAGGCRAGGLLLVQRGMASIQKRELPNLELAGMWAARSDDVFIASPSFGVLRLSGESLVPERTAPPGALGSGPVAVWGTGPEDLYAVGNGRILRRRGDNQWEVERNIPGEQQHGIWGSGTGDIYVVGSVDGQGAVWHRSSVGAPFLRELIIGAQPQVLLSIWGNAADDVYAGADGGLVLRRDNAGMWQVDRAPSKDQASVRALWGPSRGALLGVGAFGVVRRDGAGMWQGELGQSLTGATLRGLAVTATREVYAVGDGGVVLHQRDGRWEREARMSTEGTLHAVSVAPDGIAYAVGERGVVLRRDKDGIWTIDRPPGNLAEPTLMAVVQPGRSEVVAVGEKGRVLLRRGGLWEVQKVDAGAGRQLDATLRAVAALEDGTVVAAGDEGTVVWRPMAASSFAVVNHEPGGVLSYRGLTVFPSDKGQELWACAEGGAALLGFRKGQFSRIAAPIEATGIFGTSAADIYLTGRDGSVMHFDGDDWAREPTPSGEPLLAISGSAASVIAVGEQGYIIERSYR